MLKVETQKGMPEHQLVRQVLLNCIKPTHETLFADAPNLSIENATKMSKDRKLWSSNRPSLRCQPTRPCLIGFKHGALLYLEGCAAITLPEKAVSGHFLKPANKNVAQVVLRISNYIFRKRSS